MTDTQWLLKLSLDDCIQCFSFSDLYDNIKRLGPNVIILAGEKGLEILELQSKTMVNRYNPELKALDYDTKLKAGIFAGVQLNGHGEWQERYPENIPLFLLVEIEKTTDIRVQ